MSVKVACDVCRHLYHVPEERLKTEQKCRECTAVFKMVEFDEEAERKLHQPEGPSVIMQMWQWTKTGATSVLVLAVLAMLVSLLWVDPRGGTWAGSGSSAARNSYARQSPSTNYRPTNRTPQQNYRPPSYPSPVNNSTANSNQPRPFPTTNSTPHVDVNKMHEETMNRAREMMEKMKAEHPIPSLTPPPIPSPTSGMDFGTSTRNSVGSRPPAFPGSRLAPRNPNGTSRPNPFQSPSSNSVPPGTSPKPMSDHSMAIKYRGPSPLRPPSGKSVSTIDQLKPKQIIAVQHGSMWYPADVMEIQDDKVKIHYRGWSNSWDEAVPLSRIQFAHDGVNAPE